MRLLRILIGVGAIAFGFIVYPYYLNYVITPLVDLIESMFPGLNAWESAYLDILPFAAFAIILFCGVMYILGKIQGDSEIKD